MTGRAFPTNPRLIRTGKASVCFGEMTPIVYKGQLLLAAVGLSHVPQSPFKTGGLWVGDADTGEVLSRFGEGYGFANAFVEGDDIHVFAAKNEAGSSGVKRIECFKSSDLKKWDKKEVLEASNGELFFNQTVCKAGEKYVMAFEVKDEKTVPFTIYFAESTDLVTWQRVSDAVYGTDRYTACPALRYVDGWYYLFYLEHRTPRWWFEMSLARSQDLINWQQCLKDPVLQPVDAELCNASDIDLVEFEGNVVVWYCYGNQRGMGCSASALFDGSMNEFLNWYFI